MRHRAQSAAPITGFFLAALLLIGSPAIAQQDANQAQNQGQASQQDQQQGSDQQAPVSAIRAPLGGAFAPDSGGSGDALQADTAPPSGAQQLSLGATGENRSFWQPHLDFTASGDSNPPESTSPGWTDYFSILGGLEVNKVSGISDLNLRYSGGGMLSNDPLVGNSMIHEGSLAEKITWGRGSLSLMDQATYFPEAAFGYGLGLPALPASPALNLQPGLAPGETVYTQGSRLANSSMGEIDVLASERSSFTLVGGYTLLNNYGAGLFDFTDTIAQAGYNRQLSPANTLSVSYHFSNYDFSRAVFPAGQNTIRDNSAELSFARRITGRLAFQAAAGPEYATFLSKGHWYWGANTALNYQLERTGYQLAYTHGISGGSGVFAGALTDSVSGAIARALSQSVRGSINGGYARNRAIDSFVSVQGFGNDAFDFWYGGSSLEHPFNRRTDVTLTYQFQYQVASATCVTGAVLCGSLRRHAVSLTLGWKGRPIAF